MRQPPRPQRPDASVSCFPPHVIYSVILPGIAGRPPDRSARAALLTCSTIWVKASVPVPVALAGRLEYAIAAGCPLRREIRPRLQQKPNTRTDRAPRSANDEIGRA